MNKEKTFYTADRKVWRQWLKDHCESEKEVWFVFPTKGAGEPSLSYNDAVEEALCFGWIDSTAGKIDDTHGSRRFCPRRPGSPYSRPNIERLIWLEKEGMIAEKLRGKLLPMLQAPYVFPADILAAVEADVTVKRNFENFSPSYKRIRISYINDARNRPEEFAKRLKNFIEKTKENKLIVGFGGIDKYYKNP